MEPNFEPRIYRQSGGIDRSRETPPGRRAIGPQNADCRGDGIAAVVIALQGGNCSSEVIGGGTRSWPGLVPFVSLGHNTVPKTILKEKCSKEKCSKENRSTRLVWEI